MREGAECEVYARPMHIMHAALLALGVLAIAAAAEIIFTGSAVFWLAGILATAALVPEAELFSYVMTESVTFSLYSIAALALLLVLQAPRPGRILATGSLFGLLCLTRPSFVVLAPIVAGLIAANGLWRLRAGWQPVTRHLLVFAMAWLLIVGPWLVRNAVSVGKWGLTEEYGSATLIERFAFNDMSVREFVLAFPYCLPEIGAPIVDRVLGPQAMERFVYDTPRSFFRVGRLARDKLVEAHGRLDPLIGELVRTEMRERWWRHLLVSLAIGLVRDVGRRIAGTRVGAAVRLGIGARGAPLQTPVPALCCAGPDYARIACRGRQPLHPLQSHLDWSVLRRRSLDHIRFRGIGSARGRYPPACVHPRA